MVVRTKYTNSSGIYLIKSLCKNTEYIGSAIYPRRRKSEHICSLLKGNHHNRYLQRHVNKYGIKDLIFGILEICTKENLLKKEQYWMDTVHPRFNFYLIAGSPLGSKWTEEQKRNMSLARTGKKYGPMSEEAKANISKALLGKKRAPFTEEHKKNIGFSNKGKYGYWNGLHHSDETKLKMHKKRKLYWKQWRWKHGKIY